MVLKNVSCPYPDYYHDTMRCCICGEYSRDCKCSQLDAINHITRYHINDPNCGIDGHPTVLKMIMSGMPAPTAVCRNCGMTPEFVTLGGSSV